MLQLAQLALVTYMTQALIARTDLPMYATLATRDSLSPCAIGGNHCRLGHIGWEQSLSSHPCESAGHFFLDAFLELIGYHTGSAQELLAGSLKLRYCKTPFVRKLKTAEAQAEFGQKRMGKAKF